MSTPTGLIKTSPDTGIFGAQSVIRKVVCISCCRVVPSARSAKTHSDCCTKRSLPSADVCDMFNSAISLVHSLPPTPEHLASLYQNAPFTNYETKDGSCGIISPLQGIRISSGYQCSLCPTCTSDASSMKRHLTTHTLPTSEVGPTWNHIHSRNSVFLQNIHSGKFSRPFPVKYTPTTPSPNHTIKPPVSQSVSPLPPPTIQPSPIIPPTSKAIPNSSTTSSHTLHTLMNPHSVQEREEERNRMDAFVALTYWDRIIESYNLSMESAFEFIGHRYNRSTIELAIIEDTKHYLSNMESNILNVHSTIKRKINLKRNYDLHIVTPSTCKRYAEHCARLIICAYRSRDSSYTFIPDHQPALQIYISSLESNQSLEDRAVPFHTLFSTIMLATQPSSTLVKHLFLRFFLACSGVKSISNHNNNSRTYQYINATEGTHLLAALQYSISCACLQEIIKVSKDVTISSNDISNKELQVLDNIDLDGFTAAAWLRDSLSKAMEINNTTEEGRIYYEDCTAHTNSICGIVRNVHLSLSKEGDIVKSVHKNIDNLFDKLLFGSSLPTGLTSFIANILDNKRNYQPGYSFLTDPSQQSSIQNYTIWLVNMLKTNIKATSALIQPNIPSSPLSNTPVHTIEGVNMYDQGIYNWLDDCQKLQHAILVSLHLSSGLPARGSEIATFLVHNTSYNQRNIFVSQGHVYIESHYGKGRAMRQSDRFTIRFPDKESSDRLLIYLSVFKGLESIMVGAMYGNDAMTNHWNSLFINKGIVTKENDICNTIKTALHHHGIPLQFNELRHHSTGITRRIASFAKEETIRDIGLQLYRTGQEQAGHSVSTAERRYAIRSYDHSNLSLTKLAEIRQWCYYWHKSLGLTPCPTTNSTFYPSNSDQQEKSFKSSPYPPSSLSRQQATPSVISKRSSAILDKNQEAEHASSILLEKYNKEIGTFITKAVNEAIGSKLSSALPQPPSKRIKLDHQPSPSNEISLEYPKPFNFNMNLNKYTTGLKQLSQNKLHSFKSFHQYIVTDAIHTTLSNLLVIMPTGSGKTNSLLLPIHLETDDGKVTFLIVPLVSLVQDLKQRAKDMNIKVGGWNNIKNCSSFQLIILSVEHLSQPSLLSILGMLHQSNKVRRIVFDEAHLFLQWHTFRSSMRNIKGTISTLQITAPIILLTATCPPNQRKKLVSMFNINHATVFDMPTVRNNLSYQVVNVDKLVKGQYSSSLNLLLEQLDKSISNNIQQLVNTKKQGRILVFSMTRHMADRTYEFLKQRINIDTVDISIYHSGVPTETRHTTQENWMKPHHINQPSIKIMCCTSAFGTGIDVPDVRYVYHIGATYSIMDYIQESGRAGRDNQPATCTLIYSSSFAHSFRDGTNGLDQHLTEDDEVYQIQQYNQLISYAENEVLCRRVNLFSHMDSQLPSFCLFDQNPVLCDCCQLQQQLHSPASPSEIIPAPSQPSSSHLPPTPSSTHERNEYLEIASILEQPAILQQNVSTSHVTPLHEFQEFGLRIKALCIPCYVSKGVEVNHFMRDCPYGTHLCFRCHDTSHQGGIRNCPFKYIHKDHCSGCFLNQCDNIPVHSTTTMGIQCQFEKCRDLCWMIWNHKKSWRDMIVSKFFNSSFSTQYSSTSQNGKKEHVNALFDKWIRSHNRIPNIIRICLWWKHNGSSIRCS